MLPETKEEQDARIKRKSKFDEVLSFGSVFGRLTSLGVVRTVTKQREWLFLCECGALKWNSGSYVVRGVVKSCGCFAASQAADRCRSRTKHGLSTHPLWSVHRNMMDRCYKPSHVGYGDYGGRGIAVDTRWHDFLTFYADTAAYWFAGSNIDRERNNEGYGPHNFRFVTPKINQRNRRDNVLIEIDGVTRCMSEWAEMHGITQKLFRQRMVRDGKSPKAALGIKEKNKDVTDK